MFSFQNIVSAKWNIMAEESAKKKLPENVEEGVDPDLDSLLDGKFE